MSDSTNSKNAYAGKEILSDLTLAKNYNLHLKILLQENYSPGDKVLDFGAGNGHFLSQIGDKSGNYFAVEPDPKLSDLIRQSGIASLVEPENIQVGAFDFIYSLNTLEHIEDDKAVFADFFQWLKPGGTLLIYVPAVPHLYSRFDASIGHFRRYTRTELIEKALGVGFHIEAARFMDPMGYFLALAYRLFFNSGKLTLGQVRLFDRYFYQISKTISPLTENLFGKNLILIAKK